MHIYSIPIPDDKDQQNTLTTLLITLENVFPGKTKVRQAYHIETESEPIAAVVASIAVHGMGKVPVVSVPTSEPAKPAKAPRTPTGTCSQCQKPAVLTKTGICKPCAMRNAQKSSDQTTRAEAHELALKASAKLRGRKLG